jgi:TetR/AcrR family transcriptional regulator, transcriptional repressor for nem operon
VLPQANDWASARVKVPLPQPRSDQDWARDYEKRATSSKSPLSILVKFVNDAATEITRGTSSCMAIKAAFEVASEDKRVQDILKADSDTGYRFLCSLITRAIAQGEISEEDDPKLLTDYFISTYIGWHDSYILHRDPVKIRKMAQYFVKQISR